MVRTTFYELFALFSNITFFERNVSLEKPEIQKKEKNINLYGKIKKCKHNDLTIYIINS